MNYTSLDHFWKALKLRHRLFSLWWRVFLCVYLSGGMGAVILAFFLEAQFFSEFTAHPTLGYVIAGMLECTKFGTRIIRKALDAAERVSLLKVSLEIAWFTTIFQIGLIILSVFCCMVTISSYLYEGMYGVGESLSYRRPIYIVESATHLVQDGLGLAITPVTVASLFSLLASALLQATSYLIFIHVAAMQSDTIEHLFEVKMSNIRPRAKLQNQYLKDLQSKEKVRQAKEESLKQLDVFTERLITDLKSKKNNVT